VFDRRQTLRELIRTQHREYMRYQEKRDEESRKRDEEFRLRDEEMREFNREILLRNEKVYKAVIAEVEEGRKQIQANTRAVLSVLDRLDAA
jgi:uncharacterized membrane protein